MSNTVSRASLKRNWFTIASLVSRDFKLKYRRSTLGILWSVLNPLLMMCVLTLVFSTFFRFQIENYPGKCSFRPDVRVNHGGDVFDT